MRDPENIPEQQNIPKQHHIPEHTHARTRDNEREEPFPLQTNVPIVALTQQIQMLQRQMQDMQQGTTL